ncbi:MAG: ParB/RepB/Spo0J family partition protein [Oscillospiraceae bacterium]
MAKKNRMKNGLDSLFDDSAFSDETSENSDSIKMVRVSLLEPNKDQPRRKFDEKKLAELSQNIAEHGVLQPILVRPLDNGGYQIVAGERRWRAARMADVKEVPVYIRELSDIEVAQLALVENLQRENLNPIEEAEGYQRLAENFNMTHESIAKSVGKSRSQISNSLRLLKLDEYVQKFLADEKLSSGHGKILAGLESHDDQVMLADKAVNEGLSVRELEKCTGEYLKSIEDVKTKAKKKPVRKKNNYLTEAKIALEQSYGRRFDFIEEKNGRVQMRVYFDNLNDFKDEMDKFNR